jgi:DNA-binding transcriptional MocR family regulator
MNIELKDGSHGPVYAQVRQQIETQIGSQTLRSGESLPSPAALAQRLSVDKGEIQRAYFELEQLGPDHETLRQRLPRQTQNRLPRPLTTASTPGDERKDHPDERPNDEPEWRRSNQ